MYVRDLNILFFGPFSDFESFDCDLQTIIESWVHRRILLALESDNAKIIDKKCGFLSFMLLTKRVVSMNLIVKIWQKWNLYNEEEKTVRRRNRDPILV